jgi:hypothetical protein
MDEFEVRKAAALRLLAQTSMRQRDYAPPLFRLLWRLGVRIPPPHFMGFVPSAVLFGVTFALICAPLIWLLTLVLPWPEMGLPSLLFRAALAGLIFGLWIAARFARTRRKFQFPKWNDLGA